jgi:hypothetical protein
MKKKIVINPPTEAEAKKYIDKWSKLEGYKEQEDALNLLFHETFPLNNNINEVLIKCSALNDFYSTNIYRIFPVAKHIVSLNIDSRLESGDVKLVDDIACGHGIKTKTKTKKEMHLFSFATKYCSHHNAEAFPIYDSYVQKILIYFRNRDAFSSFNDEDLRNSRRFKDIILDFQKFYPLKPFKLKEIDQYLWQLGKDNFKKQ